MYMNKNMLRGCAVLAILLVAYLLVIFLIPFAHTAVFWVSFVFTLIAFGVVAVSAPAAITSAIASGLRSDTTSE